MAEKKQTDQLFIVMPVNFAYDDSNYYPDGVDDSAEGVVFDSVEEAKKHAAAASVAWARELDDIQERINDADVRAPIEESPTNGDAQSRLADQALRDELKVLMVSAHQGVKLTEMYKPHTVDLNSPKWVDVVQCWPMIAAKGSDNLVAAILSDLGLYPMSIMTARKGS